MHSTQRGQSALGGVLVPHEERLQTGDTGIPFMVLVTCKSGRVLYLYGGRESGARALVFCVITMRQHVAHPSPFYAAPPQEPMGSHGR